MLEDLKLDIFPKEAGVYLFKSNDEVIYVGSSNNLYQRMAKHRNNIRKGSAHGYKQDLYQFLQSNPFAVEFQLANDYRQLEQELVEQYNPRYNSYRAYTGCGACKGREAEYSREYQKEYMKEYMKSDKGKESHRKSKNKYNNQLCNFNGETLTLCALSTRFRRKGISNPTAEAKKYLIRSK